MLDYVYFSPDFIKKRRFSIRLYVCSFFFNIMLQISNVKSFQPAAIDCYSSAHSKSNFSKLCLISNNMHQSMSPGSGEGRRRGKRRKKGGRGGSDRLTSAGLAAQAQQDPETQVNNIFFILSCTLSAQFISRRQVRLLSDKKFLVFSSNLKTQITTLWSPDAARRHRSRPRRRWWDELDTINNQWSTLALDPEIWKSWGEAFAHLWDDAG